MPHDVRHPQRNRVTPLGDIVAAPLRGSWLGNRGILHRGTEIVSFHRSDLWIICALQYRDWRAPQWAPGHYTVLFFHDEAVALAAGHRPCALCRRADYRAFRDAAADSEQMRAKDIDRRLHAERLVRGTHQRRLHSIQWTGLPDGAFVMVDGAPGLVRGDAVIPWSPHGYGPPLSRPISGHADVITPPFSLAALTAGYPVQIDVTARLSLPTANSAPPEARRDRPRRRMRNRTGPASDRIRR